MDEVKGKAGVASFTDAWIETGIYQVSTLGRMSHLLQMRGLKPNLNHAVPLSYRRIFYRCVD